jgi:phycocyanobilin:ferredoxin oxidoreductase
LVGDFFNLSYYFDNNYEKKYLLPDWAKEIFSTSALAIIPNDDEMDKLVFNVIESFEDYMEELSTAWHEPELVEYIVSGQNRYCDNQQKNERTFNVLKAKLGEDRARHFMTEILFPNIKS